MESCVQCVLSSLVRRSVSEDRNQLNPEPATKIDIMAEGGRSQKPIIHVNVNVIQDGDSVTVAGDQVGNKTEIRDSVVENVNANAPSQPDEIVRGNVQGDSAAPNSGEAVIAQLKKMNLTDSNVKASLSEVEASHLIQKGKFIEAINILEEIPSTQGNLLSILLMSAECYWKLGIKTKTNEIITSIKQLMTSSDVNCKTVQEMAENFQDSHPIRAMILRHCLSGLFLRSMEPKDAVINIWNECSLPISRIIKKLATENQAICKNVALPLIISCLEDVRQVSGANGDTKVKMEAMCLNVVGGCHYIVDEPSKAIEYFEEGVEIMKRQFGSNASKYQVLGILLSNIGCANDDLGQLKKAEEFYLKSLEAKKKATNWSNEDEKQKSVEITQNNLRSTRNKDDLNLSTKNNDVRPF